ncbi:MAG: hypothetical protein ACXWXF_06235 [Aeromicrobium sp.]
MSTSKRHRRFWPVSIAAGSIVIVMATFPAYADWSRQAHGSANTGSASRAVVDESKPHDHDSHDHNDPATKNAVSRTDATAETADPTTKTEAAANSLAVRAQRNEADPTLVPSKAPAARTFAPGDRYAMAGGCYGIRAVTNGKWVVRSGSGYAATAEEVAAAEPFHFQGTDLGTYLLFGEDKTFLSKQPLVGGIGASPTAGVDGDWTVTKTGSTFQFALPSKDTALAVDSDGALVAGSAGQFVLQRTTGCGQWSEVETNVTGSPHAGKSSFQEVRGYLDAHTHGMAFEFLGGKVHCGRPWHPYGVEAALQDCDDHKAADGNGAVLENFLSNGQPTGSHDPVGWPTFKDWPAPDSLTHEGTYYKWLERAWRGGQRLFVNLLVENNKLCQIYPLKKNSCDDMDSIRLQAKDMRDFERYIDAQSGGPGKGWYRIVTDPYQARGVINQGKMAVVMGIETSVVFGCSMKTDVPQCSPAQIGSQLDEVHKLGVRQMELVNKFDNALSGVAGDEGGASPLINAANFLETGSFWDMRKCPAGNAEGVNDRTQSTAPSSGSEQDALFGAIAKLNIPMKVPVYASGPHCNERGLTSLGDHTIQEMAKRKMIFDPDHMSVAARKASLDVAERLNYPGIVSSHSWSTPDAYPRIYKAGGVIAPYAGDSKGFVDKWKKHLTWADSRYYFGFGFGADINGLGAQGSPRGADAADKVTYPFKGIGGVTVDKQVSGQRVYDVNVDGVSHYGLYPDWIEDLRKQAGQDIVDDMARGPEAYLQMWERAEGVANDGCRDARALKRDSVIKGIAKGSTVRMVLAKTGQPHSRLNTTFTYCASSSEGRNVSLDVSFDKAGKVTGVS